MLTPRRSRLSRHADRLRSLVRPGAVARAAEAAADEPARLLLQPSTPIDPAFQQRLADQLRSISRLFAQTEPDGGAALRLKAPTPSLAPRQICGIQVLPADSSIDPKFESPLRDTKTHFAIRTVPLLCR